MLIIGIFVGKNRVRNFEFFRFGVKKRKYGKGNLNIYKYFRMFSLGCFM